MVSALLDTKRYSVTAVDINPPSLGSPNFSSTHTNVRYVRCDVLDPAALSSVFSETRPVAVIHTVGMYHLGTKRYSMEGRDAVFEVNVQGTRNVLQASKECGVESFVYTSSTTVVLDDLNRDFRNVDEKWPKHCVDTSYGLSKVSLSWVFFVFYHSLFSSPSILLLPKFPQKFNQHFQLYITPLTSPFQFQPSPILLFFSSSSIPLPHSTLFHPHHSHTPGPLRRPRPHLLHTYLPYLRPTPTPNLRSQRQHSHADPPRLHLGLPNALSPGHRHQPAGLRVHQQRGRRTRASD